MAQTHAGTADRPRWFFATPREIVGADLETGETFFRHALPFTLDGQSNAVVLTASDDGRFLAVAQAQGRSGAVLDVHAGTVALRLARGDYHPEHCAYPLCFLDDRRLVHAVEWNQLAVTNVTTGERLDPRLDETKLDYFFGSLERSPSGSKLASTGWVWQPMGLIGTLDVETWLRGPGEAALQFSVDSDAWDLPMTWLDDERIIACVLDFDRTQRLVVSKPGAEAPEVSIEQPIAAALAVRRDEVLLLGERTEAFDAHDLSRRGSLELRCHAWHPGTQEALSFASLEGSGPWSLVSRPRSPVSVAAEIVSVAQREQENPSPQGRLVLADALEAAGHHGEALDHLRSEAAHGHRCFIVDDLASG
ncbi:MAG: hypothetical protein Q8N26_05815 [Myxococcales bacterium]|nr:hypothetical protein [Myxococcales bacterium]